MTDGFGNPQLRDPSSAILIFRPTSGIEWDMRFLFFGIAALSNAERMSEWVADSKAARILAGRLRNDHA